MTSRQQKLKYIDKVRTLLLIGLLTIAFDNYSCSCSRVGILKNQKESDFIFLGRVINVNEVVSQETITGTDRKVEYRRFEFTFQVIKIYKGKKIKDFKDKITIISTGDDTDCGSYFDKDKKYLVYSHKTDSKLGMGIYDQKVNPFMTTNLCTRTKKAKPLTFFERLILTVT